MSKNKKKQIPFLLLMLLTGMGCGIVAIRYFEAAAESQELWQYMLGVAGVVVIMYLMFFVQIAAHEAGHLVFGLATGYGFVSYRIGSLTVVRSEDKLRFARYTVAGTGGQCLLSPPKRNADGSYQYRLYNLGGVLVNLILGAAMTAAGIAVEMDNLGGTALAVGGIVGFGMALSNGLPFLGVDNDGKNLLVISRSNEARDAFYIQLETVAAYASGKRPRDFGEGFFAVSGDMDMTSGIMSAIPVFEAGRLLDSGDIAGAEKLGSELIGKFSGIQKGSLVCDLITCRLLLGNIDGAMPLIDKEQMSYMRAMRTYPQTIRTEYAIARLGGDTGDIMKQLLGKPMTADELRRKLETACAAHPYRGEAESELDIAAQIDSAADAG